MSDSVILNLWTIEVLTFTTDDLVLQANKKEKESLVKFEFMEE